MTSVTSANFGLLIAYILPGMLTLVSLADYSPTVRLWLGTSPPNAPTVGGFLYVTLASVAAGMIVSALRWLVLDPIHHATGVLPSDEEFASLPDKLDAFMVVVENHYRYFQFYGNALIAFVVFALAKLPSIVPLSPTSGPAILVAAGLFALLFVASRDALQRYYARTGALLNSLPLSPRSPAMTNGIGHKKPASGKPAPVAPKKRQPNARGKNAAEARTQQK